MARPIVQLAERLLERQPGIEYWQQVLPSKALLNRSLTRSKFAEFLGKQKPSLVAFEPCATAHYWARAAERHRHEARIIPAKAVALFRQGHKADSKDALAVAEAAR